MYEQFSNPGRIVMQRAEQLARLCQHEYIGTEHILLALAKEESGVAAHVLKNLGVDPRRVAHEVEKITQSGKDRGTSEKLRLTPRAKTAILYAMEESRRLLHDFS
jgi:ATP-dependent Clp protease ATP-binding subunit ClpC